MQNIDPIEPNQVDVHKVLRNTYTLLACALAFSALTAYLSILVGIGYGVGLLCTLAAILIQWFVLPRTTDPVLGVGIVFAVTGLLGASIGPMLNHFLSLPHVGTLVIQALAGTALMFFTLSAYVLTTGKGFSFMSGFLIVTLVAVIITVLDSIVLSFSGVQIRGLSVFISWVVVLLMLGSMLCGASEIKNDG